MNTDIRLSVGFFRNIKVRKLRKALGAEGVLSLQALWLFCAENAPDGKLGKYSDDIEFIVDWNGEESLFTATLLDLGFLDKEDDGTLSVHDWSGNNPYVAASEARSDAGRLARLKRENPEAAKQFETNGRKGISQAEYQSAKYQPSQELQAQNVGTLKVPTKVPTTNLEGETYSSTSTSTSTNTKDYYYDAREKGGAGGKETQPPAEEAAASLSTPSGSMAQPQEPEPEELVLSAAPAKPPAPSKPQPVSAQAIADLWNRMMPERGFARVTRVTNQRAAHIRARQREFKTRGAETLDFWRKVFVVTYRSDLLNGTRGRTGKDGRRWQADFDFCIESEEKLTRLIEGKYDNNDSGGYEWVDYQSPPQRLDKAG